MQDNLMPVGPLTYATDLSFLAEIAGNLED
jgi:hypothetical protein